MQLLTMSRVLRFIVVIFTLAAISLFSLSSYIAAAPGSGAIWTTTGSCGAPQNVNHYPSGSIIYVNGSNFDPNTNYNWEISDPGNNGTTYLSGNVLTLGTGAFCFAAGVVPDGGPYQAKIENVKGDNFSIDDPISSPTPSVSPTLSPSPQPTASPSVSPTVSPTPEPTATPTIEPTPSPSPAESPSPEPTASPSPEPTATPTEQPTASPSESPTPSPEVSPSPEESATPSPSPTASPDQSPSPEPTASPSAEPTATPEVLGDSTESDVCANIDGVQTSVPSDLHIDASGRICVAFSIPSGDGGNNNGSSTGQVLGASTTNTAGRVLGASTLAATGETDIKLTLTMIWFGIISTGTGLYVNKKVLQNNSSKE
jgi:outer membrane biosynthesis protein TonB